MTDATNDEDLLEIELDEGQDSGAAQQPVSKPGKGDGDEILVVEKAEDKPDTEQAAAVAGELRRQLEEQRRQLAEANRARAEAESRAESALSTAQDSNYNTIVNAIAARETVLAQAKAEMATAIEQGDGAKAANLQQQISDLVFDLRTLNNGKAHLEEQGRRPAEGRVEPQREPTREPVREPTVEDRKEQILRTVHPRSAEWLRKHDECLTDPKKNSLMMAAHHEAVANDIEPNTDAYFAHIEKKLGYRKETEMPQEAPKPRSTPMPSAPAARDMSSGGGVPKNVVVLTRDEREIADAMGMTYKDYALQKRALIKEGLLKG